MILMETKNLDTGGLFFKTNKTWQEGGGFTSNIVHTQFNKLGLGIAVGAVGLGGPILTEALRNRNRMKAGPIKYVGGPSKMTGSFRTEAAEIASKIEDPVERQKAVRKMMRTSASTGLSNVDEYGVDADFVSAFYGMGNG